MHLRRTTICTAATTLALLPATAFAATVTGTDGGERLRGTNAPDTIDAAGGNDRVFGRAGDDALTGGSGNDRIFGWRGNDTIDGGTEGDRIFGGPGNDAITAGDGHDRMSGGIGDDVQDGGTGNDVIYANRGTDTSSGGEGDDVLWAMARKDVTPGPGGAVDQVGDTLDGGAGNDRFRTRDGEVDRITCGEGRDRAFLDLVDVIADATAENPNGSCERVERQVPRGGSGAEDAQEESAEAKAQA